MRRRSWLLLGLVFTLLAWWLLSKLGQTPNTAIAKRSRSTFSASGDAQLKSPRHEQPVPPRSHTLKATPEALPPTGAREQATSRARAAASALRDGRRSIYFERDQFVEEWLARNETLVEDLAALLVDAPAIGNATSLIGSSPEILERMAALDTLEEIAHTESTTDASAAAKEALGEIATRQLPRDWSEQTRRSMVGEKFDALSALARVDRGAAFSRFALLSDKQRQILRPALILGLVDTGVPREKADEEFTRQVALASSAEKTAQ